MKRVGSAPSCLSAAGAADDWRNLRRTRRRAVDLPRLEDDRAPLPQAALGQRHHLDHALIGLARILAEREDAVLVQDQAFGLRVLLEYRRGRLGETEARRDVGDDPHAPVVDLARQGLAVGLVDQRQHGRGMGVVDEFVRQEGMQQRLDRGVGRGGIEQVQPLHVDHRLVGQRLERAQLSERFELHHRQAPRLDIGHVGARAFDGDHLVLLPEIVRPLRLHRGVAAAVQHQQRVAPQQARGVDPERDVLADALGGVGLHRLARGAVVPLAFHGARCCKFRPLSQVLLERLRAARRAMRPARRRARGGTRRTPSNDRRAGSHRGGNWAASRQDDRRRPAGRWCRRFPAR